MGAVCCLTFELRRPRRQTVAAVAGRRLSEWLGRSAPRRLPEARTQAPICVDGCGCRCFRAWDRTSLDRHATSLKRAPAPDLMMTADLGVPNWRATNEISSAFAFPSMGGDLRLAKYVPSSSFSSALILALGLTLT